MGGCLQGGGDLSLQGTKALGREKGVGNIRGLGQPEAAEGQAQWEVSFLVGDKTGSRGQVACLSLSVCLSAPLTLTKPTTCFLACSSRGRNLR